MELLVAFNISYLVISCVLGILGNAIIIRVFKKRQTNVATDNYTDHRLGCCRSYEQRPVYGTRYMGRR